MKLNLKCKVCGRHYKLKVDNLSRVPVWKFENCSRSCKLTHSKDKLLNFKSLENKKSNFLKGDYKIQI